ncbi:MAG TPA: transglutaminase family protein [Acetobacteraceae bacterium]|nr:transglutaminase family protein [Acetobacteraceae bacterium]
MPLSVALTHRTTYHYDRLVALGPQTIRLRPAPHARTPVLSYALIVEPKPHFINWQQDPQGNHLARVVFPERVTHFDVTVDLVADMATIDPFDFFLEPEAEQWPFSYDPLLEQELAPFRRLAPIGPRLQALLDAVPRGEQRTVDMLVGLNRAVQSRVAYIVRMEPGVWTPEETLAAGQGSCRDSAWLLVQALRQLGYAARFVSGYLIQLVGDVKPLTGPEGPTADFTDLHAWAEAYLPGAGWVGLDATSGLLTGEGHIPLAATPDPQSAAAITGAVEKCETEFGFDMHVTRVRETPRVTKPYSEAQWQDILAMGAAVDRALAAGNVRLTMGGEPTFVAATDFDEPEWNTNALGPTKQRLAAQLMGRLRALWAPGSALQNVSGKHYPGEQLPRWALYAHWRADGEPVWRTQELLATEEDTDTATPADAARFCAALAERLQVDPSLINPAYEDTDYYLWREHRLPANVVAENAKLADEMERARLARVFGHGLDASVGSVLPLRRAVRDDVRIWQSGKWYFRDGTVFLVPGDSPIGFRLPLDSLPWADPDAIETDAEPDPFAPLPPLPPRQTLRPAAPPSDTMGAGAEGFRPVAQEAPVVGRGEPDLVRTALCVEPRGGMIHVFFPPLYAADDWLALVAAVEDTAGELGRKVVLEGYLPPRDPRLQHFSVTPDPGVIEVNVHPASSWTEIVQRGDQLYEEARQVGLATEKFMIDGRHVGTGGGNHVVMGAADANDSPFLRRPDLLKSLLGFWHNHPSLSYLFSGLFIGPSSQHPRIDEARQDSLGELEIAFAQIVPKQEVAPWLVDRMFRHLLADMTGNTHRTEFCIDKLYAPETATGRLGLVECRALEMPPHARMSAAQLLLMRAAVAAFWDRPYERRLVHWGTRIHDDFLLPHYVGQDFADVLDELGGLGYRFDPAWFAPHFEFRFPRIGEVTLHGATLEVRHALEPWHVLGEEPAGGGTARFVDSSVERVQALVSGWVDERFVLACNGSAVPLTPTERAGEYVGGVRFKAWQPPVSALHPTLPAQTPLVFDLYDRWTGRSLGGLTHHVSHPGGRNYEHFPVNANEAEARRRARFFPIGHTPGPMTEPLLALSREHPRTLDLRRVV